MSAAGSASTSSRAAYHVHLDPDAARTATEHGGTLLLLGVPEGTFFGLDHQGFTIGPKFKGVKMLATGVHFVAYHAVNKQGGYAALTGFFFYIRPGTVLVKQWDEALELLVSMTDLNEEARLVAGVRNFDFDDGLAPYHPQWQGEWRSLSQHITQQLLDKLCPVGGDISVALEADDLKLVAPETAAEKALQQQLQAGRERQQATRQEPQAAAAGGEADDSASMDIDRPGPSEEATPSTSGRAKAECNKGKASTGRCFYTCLPRLVKKDGATAAELTALNLDKTQLLEQLIREEYGGNEMLVLGELQFAFIAFVFGQSLEGLMQWKALLQLLLACEEGPLRSHRELFASCLAALSSQLKLSVSPPENLSPQNKPLGVPMMDELLRDSFLWQLLSSFFQLIQEASGDVPSELMLEVQKLKTLLKSSMDWDFDMCVIGDEEDEYAPVVVET